MKKTICIMLAVMLILAVSVPTFACTPRWEYKPVKIPEIKVSVEIPDKVFADWFKEHPIRFTAPVLN